MHLLLLHEHEADAVAGDLALRPARHLPDPRLVRPRGRLRRLPYGLAEAVRLLQEVQRPVLVVCAEKFSDKIGTVRTSRMIFGDGAAALVVGPPADGATPDVEVYRPTPAAP